MWDWGRQWREGGGLHPSWTTDKGLVTLQNILHVETDRFHYDYVTQMEPVEREIKMFAILNFHSHKTLKV